MPGTDVRFLLVDDDEVDLMAVKRAFRERKVANPLLVARDGIEALEMLRGNDVPAQVDKPYIILLDLNMPRMNGFEVLEWLREKAPRLVVHVLTASNRDEDVRRAYALGANSYIVKPTRMDELVAFIKALHQWHRFMRLPVRDPQFS
jgi:CheY-like chemotaxis protein